MDDLFPGRAIGVGVGFLISIVVHHYAHARAAVAMGDGTPKLMGRVSLSIKPHVDPLGTIILPAVWTVAALFGGFFPYVGWGKSQALSPHRLRDQRRGIILVSLVGPLATLAVGAGTAALAANMDLGIPRQIVGGIAVVAIFMTVWEILPLPGRDGGQILAQFLSPTARLKFQELAQYDVLFIIGVFLILQIVVFGLANPICRAFGGRFPGFSPCGSLIL